MHYNIELQTSSFWYTKSPVLRSVDQPQVPFAQSAALPVPLLSADEKKYKVSTKHAVFTLHYIRQKKSTQVIYDFRT